MKALKVFVLMASFVSVLSQPGIKARINPVGIDFLLDQVETLPIAFRLPNFVERRIFLVLESTINISQLHLVDFEFGTVSLYQIDDDSYRLTTTGAVANFTADYDVTFNPPTIPPGNGNLIFQYNMTTTLDLDLTRGTNGLTGFVFSGCNVEITDATYQKGFEFFSLDTRQHLMEHIDNQTCLTLAPSISANLSLLINQFPPQFALTPLISINTSLYSLPSVVNERSIQVEVNGKSFPTNQPNITYPYVRNALPTFETSSVMAQLAVGDYALNTLLDSFVNTGSLTFEADLNQFQLGPISFTTDFLSLILPDIVRFLNNRTLLGRLAITEVPTFELRDRNLDVNGTLDISFVAVNFSDYTREVAVTFAIDVIGSASLRVTNSTLFARVNSLSVNLRVKGTPATRVNLVLINLFLPTDILGPLLLSPLNEFLSGGIEIPPILGFDVENGTLAIVENAVLLSFSLSPVPDTFEIGSGSGDDIFDISSLGNLTGNINDLLNSNLFNTIN